jgi:RHS repeat-associated protein
VVIGVATGSDTTAPGAISNLATGSSTANSITLSWTAPGDNGSIGTASAYDIRYSTSAINDGNWASAIQATGEPAPQAAGNNQSFVVAGLSSSCTYYFAMKTGDEASVEGRNWSAISNVPTGTTTASGPMVVIGVSAGTDSTAPSAVSNLAAGSPSSNLITLTWTGPGDDGTTGRAWQYDVRYSTSAINSGNWASATQATGEPFPQAPGTSQSFTVTGLSASTTYYFAIKTGDEASNWSAVSNSPSATTSAGSASSETESFGYDILDRLTSVSGAYSESYSYNQIGNMLSKNGSSYTYPSNGVRPHAVSAVGSTSYAYDANGNMTTRGSQTITWDVENRPVTVTGGASFVYDGDGSRVKKTENGQEILYINRYFEKNLTTGTVTTSYYLGDKLIAQRAGTTLNYIHQDHLTGTSIVSTSGGALVSSISFHPYGSARSGDVPTDRKFTGQRLDGTGLYYYGARYYDPTIGRFVSPDPTVPDTRNPQAFNKYSYVINNPTGAIDPSGLDYIFVGGMSTSRKDAGHYESWIRSNLNVSQDEKIVFIPDPCHSIRPSVSERWAEIPIAINSNNLKNVKLIGHSEGAATVVRFLYEYVNDPDMMMNGNLQAVALIDCPTGFVVDNVVRGYDTSMAYDLPSALSARNIKFADIYNEADFVHGSGILPGWEKNTLNYSSSDLWRAKGRSIYPTLLLGGPLFATAWMASEHDYGYHDDWQYSPDVVNYMNNFVGM